MVAGRASARSDDGTVVLYDYSKGMAVKKWRVHQGGGMVLRWGLAVLRTLPMAAP
jgi:hypothetical protein